MKKFLLASAALVAFAAGAQAADLGAPRMPIAAAVVAPAFNWTGFYVGGSIGYWTSAMDVRDPVVGAATSGRPNPNGVKIGAHIGYLNQFANNFVVGLEGDLSWLGGTSRNGAVAGFPGQFWRARGSYDASLRGIAGVAADRALLYVTGGLALADFQGCGIVGVGAPCVAGTNFGGVRAGWTVGAGVAYAITQNVSVRGEYLYADYGSKTYAMPGNPGGLGRVQASTHTVRLGLSYHFSTGPSAVVARY